MSTFEYVYVKSKRKADLIHFDVYDNHMQYH